jgi:hypothetical protein
MGVCCGILLEPSVNLNNSSLKFLTVVYMSKGKKPVKKKEEEEEKEDEEGEEWDLEEDEDEGEAEEDDDW